MTRASISTRALAGWLAAIGWAAPILLATAGSAAADPVFSIDAALTTPEGTQFVIGSDIGAPPHKPYTSSRTNTGGIPGAAVTVTYGVVGEPGFLGSLSSAEALASGAPIRGSVDASLGVALDNLKIIDPGVAAGTPVNYDINFEIGGKIVVAAFGSAEATATVDLSYNSVGLGSVVADTNDGGESIASGIFSAGVSDVKAHTPVESGFVGGPVFADFVLVTSATVDAGPSEFGVRTGQASASSDFIDPFSFPTDGPVFNFFDASGNPLAGATVNSSDGCIVNNRFLCGGGGPTTSVPEPSTWTMLLLGFAGLGYAGWRRRGGASALRQERTRKRHRRSKRRTFITAAALALATCIAAFAGAARADIISFTPRVQIELTINFDATLPPGVATGSQLFGLASFYEDIGGDFPPVAVPPSPIDIGRLSPGGAFDTVFAPTEPCFGDGLCRLDFSFAGLTGAFETFAFGSGDTHPSLPDVAPILPVGSLIPTDPCRDASIPTEPCRASGNIIAFDAPEIVGAWTVTMTSVPEPSVWTLMLLGFAGLGYVGWRATERTRRPANY